MSTVSCTFPQSLLLFYLLELDFVVVDNVLTSPSADCFRIPALQQNCFIQRRMHRAAKSHTKEKNLKFPITSLCDSEEDGPVIFFLNGSIIWFFFYSVSLFSKLRIFISCFMRALVILSASLLQLREFHFVWRNLLLSLFESTHFSLSYNVISHRVFYSHCSCHCLLEFQVSEVATINTGREVPDSISSTHLL